MSWAQSPRRLPRDHASERTNCYLAEEHAEFSDDAAILSDLERQNADLAQRIRELLERSVRPR